MFFQIPVKTRHFGGKVILLVTWKEDGGKKIRSVDSRDKVVLITTLIDSLNSLDLFRLQLYSSTCCVHMLIYSDHNCIAPLVLSLRIYRAWNKSWKPLIFQSTKAALKDAWREWSTFLPFSLTVSLSVFWGKLLLVFERSFTYSNDSGQKQKPLSEQVSRNAIKDICLHVIIPVITEVYRASLWLLVGERSYSEQ